MIVSNETDDVVMCVQLLHTVDLALFLNHLVSLNAPILMACGLGHGWDIHRAMHNLPETCGIEFSVLLKQFWKEFAVEITRVSEVLLQCSCRKICKW